MRNSKTIFLFGCLFSFLFVFPRSSFANNLSVTNVHLGPRVPAANAVSVLFDVTWDNSWKDKINHDAVWFTVRLNDPQNAGAGKQLCRMAAVGINPSGTSSGSIAGLEIFVPADGVGAFIRRTVNSSAATVTSQGVDLVVDYTTCGFTASSNVEASVEGIEMVSVPAGAFYAGDLAASRAAFRQGVSDNAPWQITSENAITIAEANGNGLYYVSSGAPDESATGSAFVIPDAFPKGYKAFYAMKYEITEGQWADFVNALPVAVRPAHDITDNGHKNSDAVVFRNTLSCSGSPVICLSQRPARPVGYLKWTDLCAFLSWTGLRPMTELEYEKLARGPLVPVPGGFAWGDVSLVPAAQLSGTSEDGTESVLTPAANTNSGNQILSGGDSSSNGSQQGPLRAGIFSTGQSSRSSSGAGYYGAMELSGNLKEWTVSAGSPSGRGFTGGHGNGQVSVTGNADVTGWPGMDVDVSKGVTGAAGAGFRGGSWADASLSLQISDRAEAASGAADAQPTYGGRGVRTVE